MKRKMLTVKIDLGPSEQKRLNALVELGARYGMPEPVFYAYLFRIGMAAQEERTEQFKAQEEASPRPGAVPNAPQREWRQEK